MCDPVSLAVASIGTTLASTGLGIAGQAQQAIYGYQAQVARNNQITADRLAVDEVDALAIRSNAAREAWGYRTRGVALGNEATLAANRQASSGVSPLGVGASLIAGAGAVADKWYRFDRQGGVPRDDRRSS